MFKDKFALVDGKLYEVTFANGKCVSVRVEVERLRGIHRETFRRLVWDGSRDPSKHVQAVIDAATA